MTPALAMPPLPLDLHAAEEMQVEVRCAGRSATRRHAG